VDNNKIIYRNFIFLSAAQILSGFVLFFINVIIARNISISYYGIFALTLTIANLFGVISDFGISNFTIREVSREKKITGKYLINGTICKILINIILFTILVIVLVFIKSTFNLIIIIACLAISTKVLNQFFMSFFNANEKMQYSGTILTIQALLLFVFIRIFFRSAENAILNVFAIYLIVYILSSIITIVLLFKKVEINDLKYNLSSVKDIFVKSIPFGVFYICGAIYFQTDTLMLSLYTNSKEVGLYQTVIRLIMLLEIIPSLLNSAVYPTASRVYNSSKRDAGDILLKALKYIITISIPIFSATLIYHNQVITSIYGDKYISAGPLLAVLGILVPIRFAGHIIGSGLLIANKQKMRAYGTFSSIIINVVLNIILIPKFGIYGAGITSILTSLYLLLLYSYVFKQESFIDKYSGLIILCIKPIAASLIMLIVLSRIISYNFYFVVGLCAVVYLCVMVIIKGITKNDISFLFNNLNVFKSIE